MQAEPEFADFTRSYEARQPSVLWTRLVADLETPVSAMLKLADGRPYSFLLEMRRGRRGARPLFDHRPQARPDLALPRRARRDQPPRSDRAAAHSSPRRRRARRLAQRSSPRLPDRRCRHSLPPMAAGLFGYMGYDMVRLMERLPDKNPDRSAFPTPCSCARPWLRSSTTSRIWSRW